MTDNKIISYILNEASLNRVLDHTSNRNVGMLSAMRGERTAAENEAAHKELAHKIRKAGFGYIKTYSGYVENKGQPNEKKVTEKSYMVIGKKGDDKGHLLGHLRKWGKEYNQDAILHKNSNDNTANLHSMKPENKEIYHGSIGDFHPNRAGEFSSYLHKYGSSKNFEFGENGEKKSSAHKGSFKELKEEREVKFYAEPNHFSRLGAGENWRDKDYEV